MTEKNLTPAVQPAPITMGQRGVVLSTLEDLYRFSKCVAASGCAPRGFEKPEAIVVAIQYGLEIGLSPMQALQNVAVLNGRPTVYGDAMLGICMSSKLFDHRIFDEKVVGEGDQRKAVCTVGRLGREEPVTREFSVADAKRAKLWGKPGPWTEYPDRMLQMRARSWALRDAFPDVLRGAMATEELMDVLMDDGGKRPGGNEALAAKLLVDRASQPQPAREEQPAMPVTVQAATTGSASEPIQNDLLAEAEAIAEETGEKA